MPTSVNAVSRCFCRSAACMAVVSTLSTTIAFAQVATTASVSVTARVSGSLSVNTQEGLSFGTFTAPFTPRRVAFTDNGPLGRRARFTIRGDGDTELMMELIVPDVMRNGAGTLPLTDWGMRVNTVDADQGGTEAPLLQGVNRSSIRLPGAAGTTGLLYIRLSATAAPTGSQVPGAYAATVQVSLSYVGA